MQPRPLSLCVVLLLLSGCAQKTRRLHPEGTDTLQVGETVLIELPSKGRQDYEWVQMKQEQSVLQELTSITASDNVSSKSTKRYQWSFRAEQPGNVTLRFRYLPKPGKTGNARGETTFSAYVRPDRP